MKITKNLDISLTYHQLTHLLMFWEWKRCNWIDFRFIDIGFERAGYKGGFTEAWICLLGIMLHVGYWPVPFDKTDLGKRVEEARVEAKPLLDALKDGKEPPSADKPKPTWATLRDVVKRWRDEKSVPAYGPEDTYTPEMYANVLRQIDDFEKHDTPLPSGMSLTNSDSTTFYWSHGFMNWDIEVFGDGTIDHHMFLDSGDGAWVGSGKSVHSIEIREYPALKELEQAARKVLDAAKDPDGVSIYRIVGSIIGLDGIQDCLGKLDKVKP